MFARKLGRFAGGLVFALVVVFGGIGAASADTGGADTDAAGSPTSGYSTTNVTEWD